jgi:hypothetical protein
MVEEVPDSITGTHSNLPICPETPSFLPSHMSYLPKDEPSKPSSLLPILSYILKKIPFPLTSSIMLPLSQMLQFVAALIMGVNAIRVGCDFPMWMQVKLKAKVL